MATRDGKPSSLIAKFRMVSGVCACLTATAMPVAEAATGSVVFTGNVTAQNQCQITVVNDGTFGLSADRRTLSSKIAGGSAAVATVRSTRRYDVTAIALPTFTLFPNSGDQNVTFQSRWAGLSLQNGFTFAERDGNISFRTPLGLSRTQLTVNLIATRTGSEYPSGYYQGVVVIRCE